MIIVDFLAVILLLFLMVAFKSQKQMGGVVSRLGGVTV